MKCIALNSVVVGLGALLISYSSWATPRDCGTLNGYYVSVDHQHNLKIELDLTYNSLMLDYDELPDQTGAGRQEFYAPDGKSHLGDVYDTGDRYIASCSPDLFTVTRVYRGTSRTVTSRFELRDGVLIWTDQPEGGAAHEVGRYVKQRSLMGDL